MLSWFQTKDLNREVKMDGSFRPSLAETNAQHARIVGHSRRKRVERSQASPYMVESETKCPLLSCTRIHFLDDPTGCGEKDCPIKEGDRHERSEQLAQAIEDANPTILEEVDHGVE